MECYIGSNKYSNLIGRYFLRISRKLFLKSFMTELLSKAVLIVMKKLHISNFFSKFEYLDKWNLNVGRNFHEIFLYKYLLPVWIPRLLCCFFLGTLVYSAIKTDCHGITEILLKVALTTITQPPNMVVIIGHMILLRLKPLESRV